MRTQKNIQPIPITIAEMIDRWGEDSTALVLRTIGMDPTDLRFDVFMAPIGVFVKYVLVLDVEPNELPSTQARYA
jgi:hypothetical protein